MGEPIAVGHQRFVADGERSSARSGRWRRRVSSPKCPAC